MNPNKKVRRLQGLLYTSGVGTILFSLWTGIREIGIFFESLKNMSGFDEGIISVRTMKSILVAIAFLVIFGTAFFYVYIGRSAVQVSQGERKSNVYIVLAAFIVAISFITYIYEFTSAQSPGWFEAEDIILFVIDLTSNIILAEVVVYSVLLKRLRD